MAASPDRDTDDASVERVIVNIDGLDELSAIREALDGIREDIDWWIKNHRREQWAPIQRITSMPINPLAADWSERLNEFTAADLSGAPAHGRPKPRTPEQAAMAEDIDDDRHFCCEQPDLQWTGDPPFPGVACQNCGYTVADCGSVVLHPAPDDPPDAEANEPAGPAQQALF
jgi:hypothetical protein